MVHRNSSAGCCRGGGSENCECLMRAWRLVREENYAPVGDFRQGRRSLKAGLFVTA
jgi:hypothetical protein